MTALLAAAPLAVILVAMAALKRSAIVAGSVGLVVALLLTVTVFDGGDAAANAVPWLLAGAGAEAVHATGAILWIIVPALAIFEFQRRAGAIDRIRDTLATLTEDRRIQSILIAWFFGLFMEGAAGFGTPVALAAPLLVGLGYSPVRAVVLALLGHAAGVSFGAVGTPVLAQVEMTGVPAEEIALRTAMLHAVCAPVLLGVMVRVAGDGPLSRADLAWTGAAAVCFLVPSVALAAVAGAELPTLGGAMIGTAAFVLFLRRRRTGSGPGLRPLLPDLAPYLTILLLVLVSRLVPPVQDALRAPTLSWSLEDGFAGSFQPLYHPGTMLALGLLASAVATGRAALLPGAIAAALRRVVAVALALLLMLALSRIMVHSGMIGALAAAAAGVGPAWPLVAPLIGVLGTFITGSATASNILFTELHVSTAASLALPVPLMIAVQGFGAAIGNVIAPHNIIAGSATVGLLGREGDILSRTARPCIVYAVLGAIAVFVALIVS